MDLNFFKKIRILDGGMGQELLARGMHPKGTLWSASGLLNEKDHQLIIDTHLSFIKAGADVIVTNNFGCRRTRMQENKVNDLFNYVNKKACKLANKAKEISKKKILIAGSLPPQNETYLADKRRENLIEKNFYDQAKLINPYVDFFYLDVISSSKELKIALKIIDKLNKPVLVGLHIKTNGKLPSRETITKVVKKYKNKNWLGLIAACVSPEIVKKKTKELKSLNIPYGFKVNLWKSDDPLPINKIGKIKLDGIAKNPNIVLGKRDEINPKYFLNFAKKIVKHGATILGGCCETKPSHIKAISKLK